MKKILLINVLGGGNIGDLALIDSTIQELKKTLGDIEVSISAIFPETLKHLGLDVRVVSELVDLPTVYFDIKAKDRKNWKFKFYIALHTLKMFFQFFVVVLSVKISKLGLTPFYRPDVFKAVKNADLIVFNGGETLKEGSVFLSDYAFFRQSFGWWITLFQTFGTMYILKKAFKKVLIVFPNTVGPVRTKIGRLLIKNSVKCADVFIVRDSISASLLRDIGAKNFIQTSDFALLLENDAKLKFDIPERTIGVSPGLFNFESDVDLKQAYLTAHAEALDYLIEHKECDNVFFVPSNLRKDMEKSNDIQVAKLIIERMSHKDNTRIVIASTSKELQTILSRLDILVATRMHPTILASTKNVPFVSIIYDYKQTGFLSDLGLEDCGLIVNDISTEKLLTKIHFVTKNNVAIKSLMASKVKNLQAQTRNKVRACILGLLSNA